MPPLKERKKGWNHQSVANNYVESCDQCSTLSQKNLFISSLGIFARHAFWSQLHELNPIHTWTPTSLNHSSSKASTSSKKVNLLNNLFTSCFTKSDALPHFNLPSLPSPILSNVTCSHDEVLKLSIHKINTVSRPDGISSIEQQLRLLQP